MQDLQNICVKAAEDALEDNTVLYKAQGHLTNERQTAATIFRKVEVAKT